MRMLIMMKMAYFKIYRMTLQYCEIKPRKDIKIDPETGKAAEETEIDQKARFRIHRPAIFTSVDDQL